MTRPGHKLSLQIVYRPGEEQDHRFSLSDRQGRDLRNQFAWIGVNES